MGIFRLPAIGAEYLGVKFDAEYFKAMDACMQELKEPLDAWLTVPHNPLLYEPEVSRLEKNVFRYGVKGIADLVSIPGEISIDIADLQRLLKNTGAAYMSIGNACGETGWIKASVAVLNNHFLDISSPQGAKRILLKIISGYYLPLKVVSDIGDQVMVWSDNDAEIVYGVTLDPSYNQMTKIIMLASDLPSLEKIEVKK